MSNAPADRRHERPALSLAPHEPFGPVDVVDFGDRLRAAIREPMQIADDTLEIVLSTLLAGGHLLLEDRPGVGKTQLARTLAGGDRRALRARAGDRRPAADRHPRRDDLARRDGDVRVPSRPGVRQRRARRRAQPRHAEDAVRPAGGDAGAAGDRRRPHASARAAVHGDRDAEPERRLRRHLPRCRPRSWTASSRACRSAIRATRRRSRCCASRRPAAATRAGTLRELLAAQAQVEEVRASEPLLAYVVARAGGDPQPSARPRPARARARGCSCSAPRAPARRCRAATT